MGIGILVLVVVLSQFLVNPPEGYNPENASVSVNDVAQTGDDKTDPAEVDLDWRQLLKRVDFYKLWIMFTFASAAGLMIIGNVTTITFEQAGWSGGFMLVALLAVFNAIGRLLGGAIADKVRHYTMLIIIFAVAAINMLLFTVYNTPILVSLGCHNRLVLRCRFCGLSDHYCQQLRCQKLWSQLRPDHDRMGCRRHHRPDGGGRHSRLLGHIGRPILFVAACWLLRC